MGGAEAMEVSGSLQTQESSCLQSQLIFSPDKKQHQFLSLNPSAPPHPAQSL